MSPRQQEAGSRKWTFTGHPGENEMTLIQSIKSVTDSFLAFASLQPHRIAQIALGALGSLSLLTSVRYGCKPKQQIVERDIFEAGSRELSPTRDDIVNNYLKIKEENQRIRKKNLSKPIATGIAAALSALSILGVVGLQALINKVSK